VRVASWNIRSAIGPGPFPDRWWDRIDAGRLRAIGSFISELNVDLVALQEVAVLSRDGRLVDNAGDLARQLGMEVRFGAVRTFPVADGDAVTGVGCFGNALLSRLPIGSSQTVALPQAAAGAFVELPGADHPAAGLRYADAPDDIREPRCLLLARVAGMTVGSTHLSHIGSAERALQAEAAVAAFGAGGPSLLLADLNAEIDAPELDAFAGWTDGFAEPPGDAARISVDDGLRIDHVLARGVSVHDGRVARESGDLSDHYPVVAELDLRDLP
jgi:endonuclease/exonuclease/phosphatase family metal-dependent hydrolase